jgi:hypothetical protein
MRDGDAMATEGYSRDIHSIIIKEIIDPRFERYLGLESRLGDNDADVIAAADDRRGGRPVESSSNVLLEEEQAVISPRDVAESGQDTFEATITTTARGGGRRARGGGRL